MKIIPLILAILLFGQSLRAGAEVLCCQTEAESHNSSCHSETDESVTANIPVDSDSEDSCADCHCPGCIIVTTTPVAPHNFTDFVFPNFSEPILSYQNIYVSDYAFSPWQPPQA